MMMTCKMVGISINQGSLRALRVNVLKCQDQISQSNNRIASLTGLRVRDLNWARGVGSQVVAFVGSGFRPATSANYYGAAIMASPFQ
jgi:hypothetical protein